MADFLSPYKQELMFRITESPEIIKQLSYGDSNILKPRDLIMTHVFPFEYVPNSTTEQYSFIMVELEEYADKTNQRLSVLQVHFLIVSHKGVMVDPDKGGVRPDIISDELKTIMRNQSIFSTFKVRLLENSPMKVANDFHGRHVVYSVLGLDGVC